MFFVRLLIKFTFCISSICILDTAFAQFEENQLSQAVDNTSFEFLTETPPVFAQNVVSNYDQDAIQMASIEHNGATLLKTFVPNAARLRFNWKVSSESCCDYLTFSVLDQNNQQAGITRQISGETGWETVILTIPAGGHWLTWEYTKDSSVARGDDTGWVDNIRIGNTGGEPVQPKVPLNPATVLPAIISILFEEAAIPAMFTVSNPMVKEGEQANFELVLAEPAEAIVQLSCKPESGSANIWDHYEWGYDYATDGPEALVLTFSKGQKRKEINVETFSWDEYEFGEKTFKLNCKQYGTSESASGTATINYKPNIKLSYGTSYSNTVVEGESFEFEVVVEGELLSDTQVSYTIQSDTAVAGVDYIDELDGIVNFSAGEDSKIITINTIDNSSLSRASVLDISLDQAITNSSNVDVFRYDNKSLTILDNEPNYSPEVDIADISPAIGTITEKGPHLWIESVGGERVGQGLNYIYSQINSNIRVNTSYDGGIEISAEGAIQPTFDNESWYIEFGGGTEDIIVGSYWQAYSNPRYDSNENKLSIRGPNDSCQSTGSFRIFELEKSNDSITKFSADFEMYCEDSTKPLRGAIRYDVSLPDANFPPLQLPMGEPYPVLPELDSSGTVVKIEGEVGDSLTFGETYAYKSTNATFSYSPLSNNTGISIVIAPTADNLTYWSIEMQRHPLDIYNLNNGRLAVGVYDNVTRESYSELKPILDFSKLGNYCSSNNGRFRIFEISYDIYGNLDRLVADFEQSCRNGDPKAKGSIKYIR